MEKLIMLGTGDAGALGCYNTCFALGGGEEYLLVDGGGGNGILRQMQKVQLPPQKIRGIYLSQGDPESLFGVIWVIRMVGDLMRQEQYDGDLYIYCQNELVTALHTIANITLPRRFVWLFDHRILFIPVYDGDVRHMMDHSTRFFSIQSRDTRQFGFSMALQNGQKFVFAGKGLLPESCFSYVEGAGWLMHEAYCLYSQKDQYLPYEKGHCTVRDACETADQLGIPNLILTTTQDEDLAHRRQLYSAEARLYYDGSVYVPDDLETIDLG